MIGNFGEMLGLTQRFLHPAGSLSTGELRCGPWWLGKIRLVQVRGKEGLKYRSYARIGDAEIKYDMRLNALSWQSDTGPNVRAQLEVWAIDWYETREERSRPWDGLLRDGLGNWVRQWHQYSILFLSLRCLLLLYSVNYAASSFLAISCATTSPLGYVVSITKSLPTTYCVGIDSVGELAVNYQL